MRGSFNTPHWNWLDYTITTTISGWWWLEPWNFEWLFHSVGNVIIPTDELHHFFRGVAKNHQPVATGSVVGATCGAQIMSDVVNWSILIYIYSNRLEWNIYVFLWFYPLIMCLSLSIHLSIFLSIHISSKVVEYGQRNVCRSLDHRTWPGAGTSLRQEMWDFAAVPVCFNEYIYRIYPIIISRCQYTIIYP